LLNLQRVNGMTFDKLITTIVKKFAKIIGLSELNTSLWVLEHVES
jgi:hypothetical protein